MKKGQTNALNLKIRQESGVQIYTLLTSLTNHLISGAS